MDPTYIGGDVPWTLPFGDHFYSPSVQSMKSSNINREDLENIARRHGVEPFQVNTSEQHSFPLLDENHRWMNSGVFFTGQTIESDPIDSQHADFHDDHVQTFCYLCSINGHEHPRTKPRDPSSRRKLIPYNNPKALKPRPASASNRQEPNRSDLVPYRFIVRTGSKPDGGTRAQVYLYIYGSENNWTSVHLRSRAVSDTNDGFPSGSIRTFCLKGPDIGHLKHLKVNLVENRAEKEWFLKEIEITNLHSSVTWLCQFNCWLPNNENGEKPRARSSRTRRERSRSDSWSKKNLSVYALEVFTGGKRFAGTDSTIQVTMKGSQQETRKLVLSSGQADLFESNQLDTFLIIGDDLGDVQKLTVESDHRQFAPDWDLKEMVMWKIYPKRDNEELRSYFPFYQWLDKKNRKLSQEGEYFPMRENRCPGPISYEISVKTGKQLQAGTDANVFIQIFGQNGRTTKHNLDNLAKNDFERGTTSEFTIGDIDVGKIKKIIIGHDNTGVGAGWFLDSVTIRKKHSTTGRISEVFTKRLESLSQIFYRRSYETMKKNSDHGDQRSSQYRESNSVDERYGSARGILRSPVHSERGAGQKRVTWEKTKGSKSEYVEVESGHLDYQVYWVSSHLYHKKTWKIESIEEKDKTLLSPEERAAFLLDRTATPTSSRDTQADEVYEFVANRWLAADEGDRQLSVTLKPTNVQQGSSKKRESHQMERISSPIDSRTSTNDRPSSRSTREKGNSSADSKTRHDLDHRSTYGTRKDNDF